MNSNYENMISEEEYYSLKRSKKIWLIIFGVMILPGLYSLGMFVQSLIMPENYDEATNSTIAVLTMNAFIPLLLISFVGVILFLSGLKQSFFRLKLGIVIILVTMYGFVPFAYDVHYTEWANRPINYSEMDEEELQERVEDYNDQVASRLLKKRSEDKMLSLYRKMNNQELYALWKSNGDLKAYEEFQKRYMYYKMERIKYAPLTVNELERKYAVEGDSLAWFEIQTRRHMVFGQ